MSRGDARWHWVPHNAKGSTPYTDEYERPLKKFSKTFEKPLDKSTQMWYNISVRGEDEVPTDRGNEVTLRRVAKPKQV